MHTSPPPEEQEPQAGPPEIQNLLQRMEREEVESEEQAEAEETSRKPKAEPDPAPPDTRRACTTLFLTLVILPALLFGPGLPYPSNAMASASTGGLLLVLAYLDWTGRGRWMALIPVIIALLLFIHAAGLVVLARQAAA